MDKATAIENVIHHEPVPSWRWPGWYAGSGNPDLMFNEDGTVRLPKLTGIAISMAAQSHGCLSRQPSQERAEAVMEAVRERVEARGLTVEVRPSKRTDTFGVYVMPNARQSA